MDISTPSVDSGGQPESSAPNIGSGQGLAMKPAHVPDDLVREFDRYHLAGSDIDVQAAFVAMRDANPDIFWTPHNGGHWVAKRGEDINCMLRTPARFSSRSVSLPPQPPSAPKWIPVEMDPPVHAHYRRPLMQALTPSAVHALEEAVRRVAIRRSSN